MPWADPGGAAVGGITVLVGMAVDGIRVTGRLVGGTGVLVASGVSVGKGVGVLVGVGVALGGIVAVGKVSTRVDAATGVASELSPRDEANAKNSVPPMKRHPNRTMPPPNRKGRTDWIERFCSIDLPYKMADNRSGKIIAVVK